MCKITPQEIQNAKQMIVNLEVAKTMDRKTQTRRLIPNHLEIVGFEKERGLISWKISCSKTPNSYGVDEFIDDFSKYKVGEVYWIREPVKVTRFDDILQQYDYQYVSDGQNVYQANIPKKYKDHNNPRWMKNLNRVPNGCLKTMARIFSKVTNVRVERLQDMSVQDIEKEGIKTLPPIDGYHSRFSNGKNIFNEPFLAWIDLWNSTAPKGSKWNDNPYVFVYELERLEK